MVETTRQGRESDFVGIFDVLFQGKALVFREEVLAAVGLFMDAYTKEGQIRPGEGQGGRGGTDSEVPGVGEGPESGGREQEGYGVVVGGMFKGFGPGVHDVVDREELVLDILDGES